MLKSLQLQNFRGFRDVRVTPLKRVNLITGENDTGKTALLEGLFLLLSSRQGEASTLPSAFRSGHGNSQDDLLSFWQWLFFERDLQGKPLIRGEPTQGSRFFTQLAFTAPGEVEISLGRDQIHESKIIISAHGGSQTNAPDRPKVLIQSTRLGEPANDAELYNRVSLTAGGEERILELMRVVEPRLQKLRYSKITSQPLVYAHLGFQHFLPATQMGQGFSRLLTLFSEMMVSQSKVLLIDEIENGLHYSVLAEIWKGIGALAEKEDIQVFATTHSWGCIVAAYEAFAATSEFDFALHRLQRVNGQVEAVTYDREMLETSLQTELEVR